MSRHMVGCLETPDPGELIPDGFRFWLEVTPSGLRFLLAGAAERRAEAEARRTAQRRADAKAAFGRRP
jgi:hypothetical protein